MKLLLWFSQDYVVQIYVKVMVSEALFKYPFFSDALYLAQLWFWPQFYFLFDNVTDKSKVDKNKLKLFFRFPMVGINRQYKATLSNDYALKDVGSNEKIESNKFFPAF